MLSHTPCTANIRSQYVWLCVVCVCFTVIVCVCVVRVREGLEYVWAAAGLEQDQSTLVYVICMTHVVTFLKNRARKFRHQHTHSGSNGGAAQEQTAVLALDYLVDAVGPLPCRR